MKHMGNEGIPGLINDMIQYLQNLNFISSAFRLALAMGLGCIIGIDRGMKRRVAGVKTHTIVCLGAALVMMTGQYIQQNVNPAGSGDVARLGAQVISGIGFLGVGTIIVTGQRYVSGLTTAASLWTSACIGLAVGIGFYSGAILATICLLIVFRFFSKIDIYVDNHSNVYEVYMEFESDEAMSNAIKNLREEKIKISSVVVIKKKTKSQNIIIQASLEAGQWRSRNSIFRSIEEQPGLISVEEL